MSKTGWIALLAVGTCAGFVIGLLLGKGGRREAGAEHRPTRVEVETTAPPREGIGDAGLDEIRLALAEREDRIATLESELAGLRADLGVLSFEEDEEEPEETEEQRALFEKWKKLRHGILQRNDEALRSQSVGELAALLQTENRDELVGWLALVGDLGSVRCDKEKLKQPVLAALRHPDSEVRREALDCLDVVCRSEELPTVLLEPLRDGSADVRRLAAGIAAHSRQVMQNDGLVAVMEGLLKDDDQYVRAEAIRALWQRPEFARQMEDTVMELSRDPDWGKGIAGLIPDGCTVGARLAQRLAELHEVEGQRPWVPWRGLTLSDEAKPVAIAHCLSVLRGESESHRRWGALWFLGDTGDASVLAELEKIAASKDAEGIEKELAETIEQIRKRSSQPR